jgi:DNA-binding LacI/PurR family transcriptional regulator
MADVARRAGVTRLTAQRALHGQPGVGEGTREKVQRIAERLGYRPHWAARAMRSGRLGCLALLMSVERYRGFLGHELLGGIVSEASERDYHINLGALPEEKATDARYVPKALRELMADGLLINYHFGIPAKMAELIERNNIPAVWINAKRPWDCVHMDDLQAGRLATEHLLRLGHRSIAYVDYAHALDELPEVHYSALDRMAGYEEAMQAARLPSRVIWLPSKSRDREHLEFTREWLTEPHRPTGLVMYSALPAGTIALAAAQFGLQVPRDISLVAVDWPTPKSFGLEVTVAMLQPEEMGREAVRMLLEKIETPGRRKRAQAIPAVFHEGGTCAPPA